MSHPVNILVMGPGGYRVRDFVRVGLPLTLILFVAVLVFADFLAVGVVGVFVWTGGCDECYWHYAG